MHAVPTPSRRLVLALLLGSLLPHAQLTAVELDAAVVAAAREALGLESLEPRLEVATADALEWLSSRATQLDHQSQTARYDYIYVDIFDGENVTPPPFYAPPFLRDLQRCLAPGGVVIHNLHTECDASALAPRAYAAAFEGPTCTTRVRNQGNLILAAANEPARGFSGRGTFDRQQMREKAERGASRLGLCTFDAAARIDPPSSR